MSYPIRDVRPTFELTGRNYIVTGGAQGIGFTIARAICEMGGNVSIWDIQEQPVDQEAFDTLKSRFGSETLYIQTDVTKQESLEAAFQKTLDKFKSIDGCVPAAGIAIDKPFVDQTWEEFTRIQEINVRSRPFCFGSQTLMLLQVRGTFFTVQMVTKELIKQKRPGSILLIASQSAHIALPGYRMAAYNASKGGVMMLAKVLGVELAPLGIRVNTISPGFVDSEMTKNVREAKASRREGEQMWLAPPNQRLSTQNDLTGAAIYFLSDASIHTTSADIAITGGLHAGTIDGLISYEK